MSVPGLQQRHQGGLRGGGAGDVPLRTHVLLRLRGELARPRALLPAQEVDQGTIALYYNHYLKSGSHGFQKK